MCNSPKYDADGKLQNRTYPADRQTFNKTVLRWTDDCIALKQTLTTMVKNYYQIGAANGVENVQQVIKMLNFKKNTFKIGKTQNGYTEILFDKHAHKCPVTGIVHRSNNGCIAQNS